MNARWVKRRGGLRKAFGKKTNLWEKQEAKEERIIEKEKGMKEKLKSKREDERLKGKKN